RSARTPGAGATRPDRRDPDAGPEAARAGSQDHRRSVEFRARPGRIGHTASPGGLTMSNGESRSNGRGHARHPLSKLLPALRDRYVFRLFVTGLGFRSTEAV